MRSALVVAQVAGALVVLIVAGLFEGGGQSLRWRQALSDQAFQWGFVATLLAFAFTLSDSIGYAFGGATIAFLVLQRLSQFRWIRLRRA